MSRVGNAPVKVPEKVKVNLAGQQLRLEGPMGKLEISLDPAVELVVEGGVIRVKRKDEAPQTRARHGLMQRLVANGVTGVATGFQKVLEINGVGYRADVKGNLLNLTLGFSHPVEFPIPAGIKIAVDKQTRVVVSGASRALVGETAARIRKLRPPEPYKGKGIKYSDEVIVRKVGKAAATGGGK